MKIPCVDCLVLATCKSKLKDRQDENYCISNKFISPSRLCLNISKLVSSCGVILEWYNSHYKKYSSTVYMNYIIKRIYLEEKEMKTEIPCSKCLVFSICKGKYNMEIYGKYKNPVTRIVILVLDLISACPIYRDWYHKLECDYLNTVTGETFLGKKITKKIYKEILTKVNL